MTRSIAGTIYAGGEPLPYAAALARYDYFTAQAARVMGTDTVLAGDLAREAIALRGAILECRAWWRAAGWARPEDADRRIDRTNGDD